MRAMVAGAAGSCTAVIELRFGVSGGGDPALIEAGRRMPKMGNGRPPEYSQRAADFGGVSGSSPK